MFTLSVILHYKCALFRDEGQFIDVRLKVDEDFFSVHRIVLAVSSNYFYAMFTNGVKESNQEIIELKDESITSNALKIILEFVLENVVIVAGINELKSHTANTRMCTKWHRVKWSPCIKWSVYANMKSLGVSVCREVVLKLLACFSKRVILHFFWSNFLTGCR